MTPADACDDLAHALPQAAALLTEHDTQGAAVRSKPGSRPPWNSEAANALFDAAEGIRRLEVSLRLAVTGNTGQRRGGSDGNTTAALAAVSNLANAIDEHGQKLTIKLLTRWQTTIQQLPALDKTAKWDRLAVPCPFCQTRWLYAARRSGDVRCVYPDCGMTGRMEMGRFGPQVVWNDGTVWQAA